ncbi:MAG: 16S rRNA (cytosine(1402)-N(4))-methyltransferase RsmH [Armatimonadota bacterium]|nr:16S rRNA (cytosine(1402)-N(4))-methyltransferase RsmH [Armatimonadota bacterium]MDW8289754.1 16S rRNA (cytosine(1402)-N(4))-methyltransferase RsmH [Armatimonadota bacterium]
MHTHTPVMVREVLELLHPQPGAIVVDATVGLGGHSVEIAPRLVPGGWLIGIDRDPQALEIAGRRLEPFSGAMRVTLVHADFRELPQILSARGIEGIDGILYDLGVSSLQLDSAERGFSFRFDAPLDMRMDTSRPGVTAQEIVNRWSEADLRQLIWEYGEEPAAARIAHAIVQNRPIGSTQQLAAIVARAAGRRGGRLHPATRTFQALRIAVNRELEGLQEAIEQAIRHLLPGGRIVVLSYHSLEARAVKRAFQRLSGKCICPTGTLMCQCGAERWIQVLTPHALKPEAEEVARNPRSRSAQCRAAQRLMGA